MKQRSMLVALTLLVIVAAASLFVGVRGLTLLGLLRGQDDQVQIFLAGAGYSAMLVMEKTYGPEATSRRSS